MEPNHWFNAVPRTVEDVDAAVENLFRKQLAGHNVGQYHDVLARLYDFRCRIKICGIDNTLTFDQILDPTKG